MSLVLMFLVAVTNAVLRSNTLHSIRNSSFFFQTCRNYFKFISTIQF